MLRAKRYKTPLACTTCRKRKLKCDGVRPACGRCREKDHLRRTCTFIPCAEEAFSTSSRHSIELIGPEEVPVTAAVQSVLDTEQTPINSPSVVYGDADAVGFASKVEAAIDARLGLRSGDKRCPIPFTDAPLFADKLSRRRTQRLDKVTSNVDNVLPPRKHADHLISLYWQRMEPLEPLLDHSRFDHSYQLLFGGQELDCDETVFVSTLNAMFALATQLQESTPSEERVEMATVYFKRAWSLLQPELLIWEPGSIATVQCLLLVARFLQCTRNLHQTWMAVGVAVRMAQGLGLNILRDSTPGATPEEIRTGRQIWQCCIMMDRILSWTLGKLSMASLASISFTFDTRPDTLQQSDKDTVAAKMFDIHEITNFVMLSQVLARSSFAERLGLPPLNRRADFRAVVQIEQSMNRLDSSGTEFFTAQDIHHADEYMGRQWFLFQIRLAHGRILLFRPILAQFCFTNMTSTGATHDLESRMVQDCAVMCVENAKKIINLLRDIHNSHSAAEYLPWWYRIFYLWISSLHLIAAMLRPDVFEAAVLDHWNQAMSLLEAHEHLSPFVTRCIATFRNLWQKVGDVHKSADDHFAPENFSDLSQLMGFEANDLMTNAGLDDMSWLLNFDADANIPTMG